MTAGNSSVPDTLPAIKLCMLNVQCLRNKIPEVELLCSLNDIDFLCLCEHWLTSEEILYYENLSNLRLVSYFCRESPWGGVAIFMRQDLNYLTRPIDLDEFSEPMHAEFAGCLVTDLSLIVVTMYRSPNGSFEKFLSLCDRCLNFLVSFGLTILIGTDHNINLIGSTGEKTAFLNLLRSFNLFCTTMLPTRGNASLDNFITNLNTWDYDVSISTDQIADHKHVFLVVYSNISVSSCKPELKSVKFRMFNEASVLNFVNILKSQMIMWMDTCKSLPPDNAFSLFFDSFKKIFDFCFPEKHKTVNIGHVKKTHRGCNPKMWFGPELIQLRNRILLVNDLSKDRPHLLPTLRSLRKEYRAKIKDARAKSVVDSFNQAPNPCRAAWSFINKSLPQNKALYPPDFASSDDFNIFFINSVNSILSSIPGPSNPDKIRPVLLQNIPCNNHIFKWKHVNDNDIVKIVNDFKTSDAKDIYDMSPNLIKRVVHIIAPLLALLINGCLDSGVFPESLKVSRTVPVFKKGSRTELSSYRPISIIPTFGKVFETVLFQQLYSYLESRSLLVPAQYGFRRQRSTTLAVESLVEIILGSFEQKMSTSLLLCDLSRAFDTVQHGILIEKLKLYLGEDALGMIVSYLSHRKQVVSWNGVLSEPRPVLHGVPQGSVLGPLLFIIDINDLYFDVSGKVKMFADDSTLFSCATDPLSSQLAVENLMTVAAHWFEINKFSLNESKTQKITLTLSKSTPVNDSVKLLGFTLDPVLQWGPHVDEICRRLSRVLYLLRRLADSLTSHYLRQVYFAFFHSLMSYGIRVWGHSTSAQRILLLQKRAVRLVSGAGWLDHCRPLFIDCKILTVRSLYVYECVLAVKRREDELVLNKNVSNHCTRSNNNVFMPRVRLTKSLSCFPVTGIKYFNRLPLEIRTLPNSKFASVVKNWLLANPIYDLSEYFNLDHNDLREYL